MRIVIAGAGISGLTAALSLHAAGFRPVLFEAAGEPAPLGVGINLLPPAVRELAELGLLEELCAAGVAIDELRYLTRYGREIWREPRGLAAGYAWPQVAIHRGALHLLLLHEVRQRLGPEAVRFGAVLEDFAVEGGEVAVRFVDRRGGRPLETVRADLLVGADGIHSAVRRRFYPSEGMPKWNGVTLWRSTTRLAAPLAGRSMIWAGHSRRKFVAYPIAHDPATGETLLNWVCDLKGEGGETPPREDWNRKGDRRILLQRFADWAWQGIDVPAIVGAAGDIFEFPMADRDPLPRWSFGPVTLIGDAAHPMYPIGSNGATQGVIDGRALAFHLARTGGVETALAAYEAERRPATSRIVLMNRELGPDQVMELAEQRAPTPAHDLDALLPMAERAAIAAHYKRVAGVDPAALAARASYSVSPKEPAAES
ncbi:MAG TPA: flavin-dependent oxidoreductase [Caulobacteraceae bacterium]|nr:flavin-dependent oxidoreductase [Caulobacteraceae bacterium]